MIRTSLYADDAAIFMVPNKDDINYLSSILQQFGDVTGLVTNCIKSHVAAIRCENIDLDHVLQAFPATRSNFPMKYLGLLLSVKRLKRIHFQPLEDKMANKLMPWIGKHVTMAGRGTLVKSVLTSIAIYFITVLNVLMEVLMKIDSIRRAFLWAGCEKVTGGKCKVNREMVCKPKEFGGLGILNLTKFASALRMRRLWHEWNDETKPWAGLGTPCTPQDKELFAAATRVTIGNGKKAQFWEAPWL
jgi:hypothetical protein